MKTIALFSALALGALTSAAMAGERTTLSDDQMDKIAGGAPPGTPGQGVRTASPNQTIGVFTNAQNGNGIDTAYTVGGAGQAANVNHFIGTATAPGRNR